MITNYNKDCNVFDKPVYGAVIVAGTGARAIQSPRAADPLSQRPVLNIRHLPDALRTPQAIRYWQALYDEGLVDHNCMPLRGRTETSLIAERLGHALDIHELWKTFETLWNMTNLHGSRGKALDSKGDWKCKAKLDKIFGKEE